MAEGQDLRFEFGARSEGGPNRRQERRDARPHDRWTLSGATGKLNRCKRYQISDRLCQERAWEARCCTRDEGGPFGAGLQEQASNSRELLPSKGGGGERHGKRREDIASCVSWRDERKQTTDEASKDI